MGENRETGASQSPIQPGPGERVDTAPGVQAIIKESPTPSAAEKPASPSRRKFLGGLAAFAGAVGLGALIGNSKQEAPAPPQIPDSAAGSDNSSDLDSSVPPAQPLPIDENQYGPDGEDILPMMPPNPDNVLAKVETGAKAESGPYPVPEENIPEAMPRMAPKDDGPVNA